MEFNRKQKVIKLEPMREQNLFYEPGDIVLGGTDKFKPWPCIIRNFLGYDQRQVQVYRVDFLCTNEYCNLETEFLIPITKTKLKRLRTSRNYSHKRDKFLKALDMAEKKIREYQEKAKNDDDKMYRFMRLYQSDKSQVNGFIEVENFKLPTELDLLEKQKKQKRHRLRFSKQTNIAIENISSKNLITSIITSEGKSFLSNWRIITAKQEKLQNCVTVAIKNWNQRHQIMEEQ